jgi:hypothetical protein
MIWFIIIVVLFFSVGALVVAYRSEHRDAFAGAFLVAYGAFGFLSLFAIAANRSLAPSWLELPNARPLAGLAVDSEGGVYVGSKPLGRIQKYDRSGNFLLAIIPATHGGTFDFHIDELDRLRVFAVRRRSQQVFTRDGVLLQTARWEDLRNSPAKDTHVERDGVVITAWSYLFPRIVIADGRERTERVIAPNPFLFCMFSPVHGWAILAVGLVWLKLRGAKLGAPALWKTPR